MASVAHCRHAMPGEYVRVFNKLSGTIVIKQADAGKPEDVEDIPPE